MSLQDIAAVRDHLAMLHTNKLVPTRRDILQELLVANDAPANESNLALAQDIYFRGMSMALSQSARRYGGKFVEADDFVDQIFKDRAQSGAARVPFGYDSMPLSYVAAPQPNVVPANNAAELEPNPVDDRFRSMADLLISKRSKSECWTTKSRNQANQIFTLLARFMLEERSITRMSQVRQKDLATFVNFLEAEIYKHHGKSEGQSP